MTDRIFFSRISAAIIALLAAVHGAAAFPADTYTRQSVLAQGKTIKIAVQADGLYRIPAATLRAWGFSDPEKVRIYGYPATRIPDPLTTGNYRDDLPMLQSTVSDGAVIFYAEAPGRWVNSDGGTYYEPNDFTQRSYYFVAEDHDGSRPARAIGTVGNPGTEGSSAPATEFTDRLHHERELVSPGEAGPLLVGCRVYTSDAADD
ncbi:MAG: hypothetical protein K2F63_06980 [Muribaculaceae bacterium]|nr:hypothetical protein [Muribaculaceae bacterium]